MSSATPAKTTKSTAFDRLLTVPEVADLLRSSTDHIYRLVRRRELAAIRVGRRVLVHPADLHDYAHLHRSLA